MRRWTDEQKTQAAALWNAGKTAQNISGHFCCLPGVINALKRRNPQLFAHRRAFLTRRQAFQCEGIGPVCFADLGAQQCRFSLAEIDEKEGPNTLYCGAETPAGKSWCETHRKVVFESGSTA